MGIFDIFKNKKDDLTNELEDFSKEQSVLQTENESNDSVKENAVKAYEILRNETRTKCIKIKLTDQKPSIFESKIGGTGYIPHDGQFPVTENGEQLRLLAQIDCSQVQLDEFPKQGLLQFWILNDDVYGLNFDYNENLKQDTFRVIYYETVDTSVTQEEVEAKFIENKFDSDELMPFNDEYGMEFYSEDDSMPIDNYLFDEKFCAIYNRLSPGSEIETYFDLDCDINEDDYDSTFGHKIGGYPAFTQEDPRENCPENDCYDFLLLQIDSDYSDDNDRVMWGDSGVANFFINSEKLKELDFSNIIYNWDCY